MSEQPLLQVHNLKTYFYTEDGVMPSVDGVDFDLHEGEYVYQDLIRAIDAQMTPAMLEDICRGCAWYPVSACKKNICGK